MATTASTHAPRIGRYILVGLGSVCIDATVYWLLVTWTGDSVLSKAVSYVSGAVFSYLANWRFTFGKRRSNWSEVAFVLIYLTSLGLNIGINQAALALLPLVWFRTALAYLLATGVTTVWNFVGQSLLVFEEGGKRANLRKPHRNEKAIDDQS